jgi:hypothetical protein
MALLNKSMFLCCLLAIGAAFSNQAVAQLSLFPSNPTPLDLVRLRWTHVGCTNPDSVRVSMQANRATVSTDRVFFVDCGTVQGYFDEYTVGRLPSGEYDIELIVNPPPGTLGPSQLIGPIHLTVGPLPPTGSLLPHEDYSDAWLDPAEPGQVLVVEQSGEGLFAVWNVYDASGRPVWYLLLPGSWIRDSENNLRYVWTVYTTTGPYWGGRFDPGAVGGAAVGTASFVPQAVTRAGFEYTIAGVTGSRKLQRFAF